MSSLVSTGNCKLGHNCNVEPRSCGLPRQVLPTSTAQTDGEVFARWRCEDTDSGVYFKPPG